MIVKAVTHIHSDWSYDGNWNLSRIANFFGKMGYDLVLTAEHDRTFDDERWEAYKIACCKAGTKKTLIVPGIEYSDVDNAIHILVWGISEFLGRDQETAHLLRMANKKNAICVLAHPSRQNAWQKVQKSWFPLLQGIEFWNRQYDGLVPSPEAMDLLRSHSTITPFVGLDFHKYNQIFPLTMAIEINGELSTNRTINALASAQWKSFALGFSALAFSDGFLFSIAKPVDRIRRFLSKLLNH